MLMVFFCLSQTNFHPAKKATLIQGRLFDAMKFFQLEPDPQPQLKGIVVNSAVYIGEPPGIAGVHIQEQNV